MPVPMIHGITATGEKVAIRVKNDGRLEVEIVGASETPSEPLKGYSDEILSSGSIITNTIIITPSTGKKLIIKAITMATESSRGAVRLDFTASAKKVFRFYATRASNISATHLHIEGQVNEALTLSGADLTNNTLTFLTVSYLEK